MKILLSANLPLEPNSAGPVSASITEKIKEAIV
jgi:hypothetical protein